MCSFGSKLKSGDSIAFRCFWYLHILPGSLLQYGLLVCMSWFPDSGTSHCGDHSFLFMTVKMSCLVGTNRSGAKFTIWNCEIGTLLGSLRRQNIFIQTFREFYSRRALLVLYWYSSISFHYIQYLIATLLFLSYTMLMWPCKCRIVDMFLLLN